MTLVQTGLQNVINATLLTSLKLVLANQRILLGDLFEQLDNEEKVNSPIQTALSNCLMLCGGIDDVLAALKKHTDPLGK